MQVLRNEAAIERAVVQRAFKELGVYAIKLNGRGRSGWPDREFLLGHDRVLFIEFKRPGENPSRLQEHTHETMRELGYTVEVHDNVDEAMASLRAAVQAARVPKSRR